MPWNRLTLPYKSSAQSAQPSGGFLYLVTDLETQQLRAALAEGKVPADLQAKLLRLNQSDLVHRFVEQNSRLIIALLMAAYDGSFREVPPVDLERLLRVLAYVRKENDATPDSQAGGYVDDQQEVRAVTSELANLLQSFKAWRLQHQVPGMWL